MWKFLFNKDLIVNLFPFCFCLCPTASGRQKARADTIGINRIQIGHRIGVKLFHESELRICFRDSGEEE